MPALAACVHCGAILFWTREGLVHPMPGEREPIRSLLGGQWIRHSATPFDGRFHRCVGTARQGPANRAREDRVPRRCTA